MNECTLELIMKNIDKACEYVSVHCKSPYINFYKLHYCTFDKSLYITLPLFLVITFICLFLLSDTCHRYLSQPLTILSDKLNMSQNLAGVTFLALGNGAPDVISAIVASGDSGGVEFSIGSLIGTGVVVTCIVFSSVVLLSKRVQLTKELFLRDVILYLITILILMLFSVNGKIGLLEAIGFFSLYIINVIIAICQDLKEKRNSNNQQNYKEFKLDLTIGDKIMNDKLMEYENHLDHNLSSKVNHSTQIVNPYASEEIARAISHNVVDFLKSRGNSMNKIVSESKKPFEKIRDSINQENDHDLEHEEHQLTKRITSVSKHEHLNKEENSFDEIQYEQSNKTYFKRSSLNFTITTGLNSIKYRLKKNFFGYKEIIWDEKGFFGKVFYILIEFPLSFLRDITVPAVEVKRWNKILFIFMPLTSPLFFLLITENLGLIWKHWHYSIAIGLILLIFSIIISRTTFKNKLPESIVLLCLHSFLMSILWIWAIANILIEVLKVTGIILNIPAIFLGMTFLSLGNAIPDLTLNCALAQAGYGEMGIAGSVAGPMFDLLIGLGTSLIKITLISGEIKFDLFKYTHVTILIGVSILVLNLIRLLIQSFILKFNMNRSVSYIGYCLYFIFFVGICLFTFVFTTNPFK